MGSSTFRGNTIDVSWAVVQRSRGMYALVSSTLISAHRIYSGFLDGGDGTMMLASGADSSYLASSDSDSGSADSFLATTTSSDSATSSINFKPLATVTLLVTNRPVALFSKPANVFLQGQVYAGFSLELEYIQAGVLNFLLFLPFSFLFLLFPLPDTQCIEQKT